MPTPIVDANVHAVVPSVTALLPYLPAFWREQVATTAFRGAPESAWPPGMPMSRHPDARIPASGPPGSDLALLREQVLDLPGIESAVLQCAYAIESIRNPDGAAAAAAAVNDWLVAEWLEPEPRLRASMVVPSHTPGAAVAEIERVGDHPGFVQVFLPIRSAMPYGRREYHPLHAAAAERGLVVGLGYGGLTGNAPTGVGWPTYLVEEFVGMAAVAQSQLMSLVVEGVFDAVPALRAVVVEAGFTWLPAMLWRLDKNWKGLRREVPWLRRAPSEYVREHVRFTTGPADAPAAGLRHVLDDMWGAELLLYGSGYPHDVVADPRAAVPAHFTDEEATAMLSGTARELYGLGSPAGAR